MVPGEKIQVSAKNGTFFPLKNGLPFCLAQPRFCEKQKWKWTLFRGYLATFAFDQPTQNSETRILEHNIRLPSKMQNMVVLYISSRFLFPMATNKTENSNKVSCHIYIHTYSIHIWDISYICMFLYHLFWLFCIFYDSQQNMDFFWNEEIIEVKKIIKERKEKKLHINNFSILRICIFLGENLKWRANMQFRHSYPDFFL